MKPIRFHGDSLDRLRQLPEPAKKRAGYQLWRVQNGLDPLDWKPLPTIGKGVREIRIKYKGQYRIVYIASMADAIHVLHVFYKKTEEMLQKEIALAEKRLKEIYHAK